MYQTGDLLWIPAGTLLNRPRIPGKDDLFSNYYQTTSPTVALFLQFISHSQCVIVMSGQSWSVDTKDIHHNIQEIKNVS
jgi:hypothetical protein